LYERTGGDVANQKMGGGNGQGTSRENYVGQEISNNYVGQEISNNYVVQEISNNYVGQEISNNFRFTCSTAI
jgi:hypothetical protein